MYPSIYLVVDTLILQDKATLQFAADKSGTLQVEAAYIGQKTLISAQGVNGLALAPEQNGSDLAIKIHLVKLNS